jgi:hypothetical protein
MGGTSKAGRSNFTVPGPPRRAVRLPRRHMRVARPLLEGDPRQGIANARRDRFRPLAAAAAEAMTVCACPF